MGKSETTQYPQTKATKEEWLQLALDTLISDGVAQIKVQQLAQTLDVSRSSFYWYFRNRQDLLEQLLHHWQNTNSRAVIEHAGRRTANITESVLHLFECWTDDRVFDSRLDFAVREWARRSGHVRRILDQADDQRVAAIAAMYERHGYKADEAFIRARVLYFMQIGYYALDLNEAMADRLSYTDLYVRSVTGEEPDAQAIQRFTAAMAQRHGADL